MRSAIVVLAVGAGLIAFPFWSYFYTQRAHARDVAGIQALERRLDSTRATLALAASAADSAAIGTRVADQEHYVGRRAFHVPLREERLRVWWRPFGPSTAAAGVGLVFVVVGGLGVRRARVVGPTQR